MRIGTVRARGSGSAAFTAVLCRALPCVCPTAWSSCTPVHRPWCCPWSRAVPSAVRSTSTASPSPESPSTLTGGQREPKPRGFPARPECTAPLCAPKHRSFLHPLKSLCPPARPQSKISSCKHPSCKPQSALPSCSPCLHAVPMPHSGTAPTRRSALLPSPYPTVMLCPQCSGPGIPQRPVQAGGTAAAPGGTGRSRAAAAGAAHAGVGTTAAGPGAARGRWRDLHLGTQAESMGTIKRRCSWLWLGRTGGGWGLWGQLIPVTKPSPLLRPHGADEAVPFALTRDQR